MAEWLVPIDVTRRHWWGKEQRICATETSLYQVVVMGSKEDATSKAADRFLDSFKLTK